MNGFAAYPEDMWEQTSLSLTTLPYTSPQPEIQLQHASLLDG